MYFPPLSATLRPPVSTAPPLKAVSRPNPTVAVPQRLSDSFAPERTPRSALGAMSAFRAAPSAAHLYSRTENGDEL